MKNKHIFFTAIMAVMASVMMTACNKNTSAEANATGKQELSLFLTDGPGIFDKVLVDIRSVKVLVDTGKDTRRHDTTNWDRAGANDQRKDSSFVWETLKITPGVYDILKFRNGADTLLASSGIAKGSIRVIKIELGTNNAVVKDSVTYPVVLPANSPNYILITLKGNECEEYLPGKIRLWLDFDITRSIILDGSKYYLRPVFHFFTVVNTASLAGTVTPREAHPLVVAFNGSDTAYALPDGDGRFKFRGLKDGTYTVYVNASNGYISTTINNVIIKAPNETSLGTIKLRN